MGRRGRKFGRFHGSEEGKSQKPKKIRPEKSPYESLVRESADFEIYYKAQKIVPEQLWADFMHSLKEPLPAAFRITGSKTQAQALLHVLQSKFFEPLSQLQMPDNLALMQDKSASAIDDDEPLPPLKPICLPWYPDGLAWQLNLTRRDIRRCEAYWQLHQFLITETDSGNISRQEAVSMIPPIVLGVEPHHKVLDMCAAPGSKTAQLIEFLHSSRDELSVAVPSGLCVANDADNRRCYMLTHQAKRLQSPTLVVTNHDAAFMPNIVHTRKDGSVGAIKYDRILCDVPCSGDGTMRKNFDVWAKWNAVNGANLHGLQLRIARRGLEMLAVGGRMVYSTCSLNPVENEAVIARLLREADGAVRLVDAADLLPDLKFLPGLESWTLMNREMEIMSSPADIPAKNSNLFHKHLFPPEEGEKIKMQLNKCLRILPHQQDTGGFFVALLEKVTPLVGEKIYLKEEPTEAETTDSTGPTTQRFKPPPKKRQRQGFKEEPYFYFDKEEPVWPPISDFFGVRKEVPVADVTHFLTRCKEGKKRNIYFTNAAVKDLVELNQDHIKIINTGVKVLVRSDNKGTICDFRLAQEGSHIMLPLITQRIVTVAREDMVMLLLNNDMETPPLLSTMHENTQRQCAEMTTGSCAFVYRDEITTVALVGWKGATSIRAYVVKHQRIHYLRLLGASTSKYERNKFEEQRSAAATATEEKEENEDGDEGVGFEVEDKEEPNQDIEEIVS